MVWWWCFFRELAFKELISFIFYADQWLMMIMRIMMMWMMTGLVHTAARLAALHHSPASEASAGAPAEYTRFTRFTSLHQWSTPDWHHISAPAMFWCIVEYTRVIFSFTFDTPDITLFARTAHHHLVFIRQNDIWLEPFSPDLFISTPEEYTRVIS